MAAAVESPEMVGADGIGKRVLLFADPLADARGWLAAMEISLLRAGQRAAQSSNVVAGPVAAEAQQPDKLPAIGLQGRESFGLMSTDFKTSCQNAFSRHGR